MSNHTEEVQSQEDESPGGISGTFKETNGDQQELTQGPEVTVKEELEEIDLRLESEINGQINDELNGDAEIVEEAEPPVPISKEAKIPEEEVPLPISKDEPAEVTPDLPEVTEPADAVAVPEVLKEDAPVLTYHPSNTATINVLTKLFETTNIKALKLSTVQKEKFNELLPVLKAGDIPLVAIVVLLQLTNNNLNLKVLIVDAISKIYTFENVKSDFNVINYKPEGTEVVYKKYSDLCIDVMSNMFKDETDDNIELQIVKTIVNIILNENVEVHTGKLLEGIRLIYNIFILTVNENIKLIAEATLTQIIDYFFQEARLQEEAKPKDGLGSGAPPSLRESLTSLQHTFGTTDVESAGSRSSVDSESVPPPVALNNLESLNNLDDQKFTEDSNDSNLFIKDCFLIFRAMSKLSTKPIDEKFLDSRSTAVRSKLLSLKFILSILKNHISIFLNPNITISSTINNEKIPFVQSIRTYMLLALTKNSVYQLNELYSICLDIFYILITNLREEFINEIPLLFQEIFLPIVEMPLSTEFQKKYFLIIISKLANDPRLLIEFYLNFDCSPNRPNIVESIINILIKSENLNLKNYKEKKKKSESIDDEDYDSTCLGCIVSILRSLHGWAKSNEEVTMEKVPGIEETPVSPMTASFEELEVDSLKKRKTKLLEFVKLFKFKPHKTIQKLIDFNFIESDDPKYVGKFLFDNNNILDKKALGEYLGEGTTYTNEVMYEFVNQFNFSGYKLIDAIRMFLQEFRLPGESQKVDRILMKFAETYYRSHTNGIFDVNTLYVFSFSVMMLNTDLHNNQVKKRMTLEDFVKNNRGLHDGKDLPFSFLEDVYNDILNNEIIMKSEHQEAMIKGNGASSIYTGTGGIFRDRGIFGSTDNKKEYIALVKELSSNTEKAMKRSGSGLKFLPANHVKYVRSIFDNLWMSFLAALTPSFQEFNNRNITRSCLEGIELSIKIACIFELEDAKKSFINGLLQFTNLINIEEIRYKNLDAINLLLNLCVSEGEYFDDSWHDILIAISQLDRLLLISQGIDASNVPDILNAKIGGDRRASSELNRSAKSLSFFKQRNPSEVAQLHHANAKLQPEISQLLSSSELTVKIYKVFEHTNQLSITGITCFVEALKLVTLDEIESSGLSDNPRIFSLQKMVDVCACNMDRIKIEWSKLWLILGETFNQIGCNPNSKVVIFALDSLRQLSMRFLELEELAYFKFQKDFLGPFEFILAHNERLEVKLLVLECLDNLISSKYNKIKSGWISIFRVISASGKDSKQVVEKSYTLLKKTKDLYFDIIFQQEEGFENLIEAYTSLGCNQELQKINLHAISDMKGLIGTVEAKQESKSIAQQEQKTDTTPDKALVFYPILRGLTQIVLKNSDLECRSESLNTLFDSLVKYGNSFDRSLWSTICYDLLFPIFNILNNKTINQGLNNHDDLSVWLSTTLIQALKNLIALFSHFDELLPMLDGYLKLLKSCILQENDTISRIGRSCLQSIILDNSEKFQPEHWDEIEGVLIDLFDSTIAQELFLLDPLREEVPQEPEAPQEEPEFDTSTDTVVITKTPKSPGEDVSNGLPSPKMLVQASPFGTPLINASPLGLPTSQMFPLPSFGSPKNTIVIKCVLQLLMIETLSELFENEDFYKRIPFKNLLKLMEALEKSYQFSHEFNENYNLRVRLWNSGVIERLPNLLKQESSSSGVYISIIFRLLINGDKVDKAEKQELLHKLVPLCVLIIENYISLDESNKQRNINTWRPVVNEILQGYYELDEDDFIKNCPIMYDLVLNILDKQLPTDLRGTIKNFLTRVGEVYLRI